MMNEEECYFNRGKIELAWTNVAGVREMGRLKN